MKRSLLLAVLLAMFINAKSQTFFKDQMVYYHIHRLDQGGTPYYFYESDTVSLDSISAGTEFYSLLLGQQIKLKTKDRKVWVNADSIWRLYYDFGLKGGDTLPLLKTPLGDSVMIIIDSTEQVWLGGRNCTVQFVHQQGGCSSGINYVFLEHYGSLDAGILFWKKFCFEFSTRCIGTCENGQGMTWDYDYSVFSGWPDLKSLDTLANCDTLHAIAVKANQERHQKMQARLFPNPAGNQIRVEFTQPGRREVMLYSYGGVLIKSVLCISKDCEIYLENDAPGIYFIRTSDGIYAKFVKQ